MAGVVSRVKKKKSFDVSENNTHIKILERWMSVAESQICALEVLCNQIPTVNKILEDNMLSLSTNFSIVANNAQQQQIAVDGIIDAATNINVGGKLTTPKDALTKISEMARLHFVDDEVQKEIDKVINGYTQKEKELLSFIDDINSAIKETLTGVSSAIVGMQFQDRVSQNLVIAENVLKEVVLYLGDSVESTAGFLNNKQATPLDKDFAKNLIGLLTLGELRHKFVQDLISHKYISDGAEVGYGKEKSKMEEGELELF